jgi:hypothetical protein
MKKNQTALLIGVLLITVLASATGRAAAGRENYVYVAPNVIQARALNVFTTFALTNTTEYWFNPRICLVNPAGDIVYQFAPLLKGFGSWQKASIDLLLEDFAGSVWIVSSQPIVGLALIHQINEDGSLTLVGNAKFERISNTAAQALTKLQE